MANIDTKHVAEKMLDGMSNMVIDSQWKTMLMDRSGFSENGSDDLLLSKDFILKYKNRLCFDSFALYVSSAWEKKGLDLEFLRRFWNFVDFVEGTDALLSFADISNTGAQFRKVYKEEVDPTSVVDISMGRVRGFTMQELDDRPFRYNGEQWKSSLHVMKEIAPEFIEKYINMMCFVSILTNDNIKEADKEFIRSKFSVELKGKIGNESTFMFPDGSVLVSNSWDNMKGGKSYLKNKNRYASEEEDAMKKLIEMYPRAVEDCFSGGNEKVMLVK